MRTDGVSTAESWVQRGDFDRAFAELFPGSPGLGIGSLLRNHPAQDVWGGNGPQNCSPLKRLATNDVADARREANPLSGREARPERRRSLRNAAGKQRSGELWALAGAAALSAGKLAEAQRCLDEALRRRPGLPGALVLRAATSVFLCRSERTNARLVSCLADLKQALEAEPDDVGALCLRAEVSSDIDDMEGARRDLERVLRIAPDNDWARAELADLLCDAGRPAEAWPFIESLERRYGKEGWFWALRGRVLALSGREEEGLCDLDRAVALSPRLAPIVAWRGEALRRLGRCGAALADFDRALELDPRFVYTLEWRSRLHLQLGQPERALADARTLLGLSWRYHFGPALRGESLFKLGRFRAAAMDFDRAYPLHPRSTWNPPFREGEGGSRAQALDDDLDAAVRRFPRSAWARAFRGSCRVTAGTLLGEGLEDLTAAIGMDPAVGSYVRVWRGFGLLRLGAPGRALADLAEERGRWARAFRGLAHSSLGRTQQALADFGRALKPEDQRFARVHCWKAAALRELGRTAEAQRELALAKALDGRLIETGGRQPPVET